VKEFGLEQFRKALLVPAVIFLVAFGVRIINLEIIKDNPFYNHPIMDEEYHDGWAQEIAAGRLFKNVPFYRTPAYPYFLGLIYALFGHGYYMPRLIGIIIGSLSCVLIYLIGKEVFSHKVGLTASLLASFYSMFLYYDTMLLTVYLEIFFCLLSFLLMLRWMKHKSRLNIIGVGFFVGLASITRPNFSILIPLFAIYIWILLKKETFKKIMHHIGLLIFGIVPTIATVMLINILIGKDLVVVAWNGGVNFYLGNNSSASGWSATAPDFDATWWGGYKDAIVIAERDLGRSLKPSQISNYWFRRGLTYIFSSPFAWLGLMIRKFYFLFNSYELSNNQSIMAFKKFSPLLQIPVLNFGTVLAFAIWGIICAIRSKKTEMIIYLMIPYAISIVIFFVCARYRMPLVPFLLIFASYAIFWIINEFKQKRWRSVVLSVITITAVIGFANTDFYGTHTVDDSKIYVSLGNRFFDTGDYVKAAKEYRKALSYNPQNTDAISALGNTYLMINQHVRRLYSLRNLSI